MIVVSPSCRTGTGASTQRSSGTRSTSNSSLTRGSSITSSSSCTTVLTRTPPVSFLRLTMKGCSSTTGMTSRSCLSRSVTWIPSGMGACCRSACACYCLEPDGAALVPAWRIRR